METMTKSDLQVLKRNLPSSIVRIIVKNKVPSFISLDNLEKARTFLLDNYGAKWVPVSCRHLLKEEKKQIQRITVVDSQFGKSMEFIMNNGNCKCIPCSTDNFFKTGEQYTSDSIKLLTLYAPWEMNPSSSHYIYRIVKANYSINVPEILDEEELMHWYNLKRQIWYNILRPIRDTQLRKLGKKPNPFMDLLLY